MTSNNAYYWWAPRKTPELVVRKLAAVLHKAMDHPDVIAQLKEWSIGTEFTRGEALGTKVEERIAAIKPFKIKARTKLPNFPRYAIILTGLFGFVALIRALKKNPTPRKAEEEKSSKSIGFLCFLVLFLYVYYFDKELMPFALLTTVMVFLIGVLICRFKIGKLLPILEIAALTGLGTEFIFTALFSVALP